VLSFTVAILLAVLFPLHHHFQKVSSTRDAWVITAHGLLALPGSLFQRPGNQLSGVFAEIVFDPSLVLGGGRNPL
jgi:hypothetical protein